MQHQHVDHLPGGVAVAVALAHSSPQRVVVTRPLTPIPRLAQGRRSRERPRLGVQQLQVVIELEALAVSALQALVHIEELLVLWGLVRWDAFTPTRLPALNPTFGEGSRLVGGADADIVVDDLIIEIKVVKEAKLAIGYVRQLVGYALLANEFGVDNVGSFEIERLGVWLRAQRGAGLVALGQVRLTRWARRDPRLLRASWGDGVTAHQAT